jgi:hypothetical protein
VKIPIALYAPCSEPEPLTPESDLTIYRAEADERRGIVIGDIWYGYGEAIAIAEYVAQFRDWLVDKAQANREREN